MMIPPVASIDQKEDLLYELCDRYGLACEYAWGTYHISNGVITRTELHEMSADCIEETVLGYALLVGF
jgi:hypothetical protein